MLKEGKYCEILDDNGNAIAILKVYSDKSHCLKIVASDIRTGELRGVQLSSRDEARKLYEFLKQHFDGEDGNMEGVIKV